MIKTAELPTEEDCIRVSKALALIARITSSAQEYYLLKDRWATLKKRSYTAIKHIKNTEIDNTKSLKE